MAEKIYILFAIDRITVNRLTVNRLTFNRLTVNRLTVNRLTVIDIPFVMDKIKCNLQPFWKKQGLIATMLSVLEALVFKVDENIHPWTIVRS